ncbi:MAG: hypothetical protein COW71_12180 [Ignavibacteriales bacterium CG18_big_fil_WC_8_21_14_2_50_31_20]|nr:MAG: hypothetical protein COW71_12180 [Ignavibacteriales bacterium CG18_big_fil_WC_8_21_14_2_50_31_20]
MFKAKWVRLNMKPKLLTKSRFKIAHECPVKLFYLNDATYQNNKEDDSFLEALAEGGFQVGELAKLYFPNGTDIKSLDYDTSLSQTNELLKNENAIIYEAAIKFQNLFIRIDVLVKEGSRVKLIEVKAKSIDTEEENIFTTKKGEIRSGWKAYLLDVAFQNYVLSNAFPDFEIENHLMLADKNALATVDGLNQKFVLTRDSNGRKGVIVKGDTSLSALGNPILTKINIDDIVIKIQEAEYDISGVTYSFENYINRLAQIYERNEKVNIPVDTHCQSCEYRVMPTDLKVGMKSGFLECWGKAYSIPEESFNKEMVFNIWNYRKKQDLLDNHQLFIEDLNAQDFAENVYQLNGPLTSDERRALQIMKVTDNDSTPYLDKVGLRGEMSNWKFPLHFIDFETTMVAIPFNKGRRPYEGIAFQFSHHIVYEDGRIEHKGEYINTEPGLFPNYEFLRALKKELENDEGTVFKYATHENTFLNHIHAQILDDKDNLKDSEELLAFIESITHNSRSAPYDWQGERDMVDMLEVVKKHYYHPSMKGSNSIKGVLPAVLKSSKFIQEKYSKPIYGSEEIPSLNYNEMVWIVKDDNDEIINPYKLLPNLFVDISLENIEDYITDPALADGGAAMTAYAKMQFTEMSDEERRLVSKGLLRYCELDTFAMVVIYEFWKNEIGKANG